MKKIILFFLFTNILLAQTPNAVMQDRMNFEPGELIVKLKDEVNTKVYYAKSGKASSDFNIGELLGISNKVKSSTMMFHQKSIEASNANKQKMKAVYAAKAAANPNNGYKPKEPLTMKNIFVVKTNDKQENILQLIEQIKDNPAVEYTEPNYIYSIDDFEVGEMITAEEAGKKSTTNSMLPIEVNDPLYSSQSNITATNIDDVWDQYTTGDGSQVIAILDTGVDYTHPDLEANIWINEAELNGVEGYDDDGNGYVDDIRGWDFINIDNAPLDDNMHGTHVAGIAGAVGNNGIGIAGAAWNVKLMPIKVFQSTGQGNSTTIAAGVEYASENGATIINMSFGGGAESFTLKLALENTYDTAVLLGAAGNNKRCIGPGPCPDGDISEPKYPGAYNYVLGVEDSAGDYDNYDQDGPVSTAYSNLLNYELKAPGSGITSTLPGGRYGTLTGTSMATPLVAGGMALYLQQKTGESKELIFGNLINTSQSSVDILAAIEVTPTPQLAVLSAITRDTIAGQNGNNFIEPGETIEILPLIRNYWGHTEDVRVGIEFAEFEDTSKATIVQNEIEIGSISAYATLQDIEETLKITISENVKHNVDIRFNLKVWSGPDQEFLSDPIEFIINVTNAIVFDDYITEDTTFSENTQYIFANNLVISNNAILTIEAGSSLDFNNSRRIVVSEGSKLFSNGTKDKPVIITSSTGRWRGIQNLNSGGGGRYYGDDDNGGTVVSIEELKEIYSENVHMKFTQFSNLDNKVSSTTAHTMYFENCIFHDFYDTSNSYLWGGCFFDKCNFFDGEVKNAASDFQSGSNYFFDTNISDIDVLRLNAQDGGSKYGFFNFTERWYDYTYFNAGHNNVNLLNIITNPPNKLGHWSNNPGTNGLHPEVYFGTSNSEILLNLWWNFDTSEVIIGKIDINNINNINNPFEGAHGIVWKVLVNGFDAQDEYALLDPIGVGSHEFKVYFNREMDTSVNPQVSYGVRMPYNQKIITEAGSWSEDGKIYTVNHDVNIGAADGINRIRVQDAQDLDYFKIPVEDSRFNMLVQSAGSASTGFLAQGGLGKIDLEWVAPSADELDDVLGYNMYRYQLSTDGVESYPEKLNETLIIEDTDESTTGVYYSDFDVLEGENYFYKYKILRTSFEETDFSQTVSSAPLTSTLGDSNGDFEVDVLDLVQNVDYIVGNNPEPFIFVAGDVNADETINILDIVGTVDIIINGDTSSSSSSSSNEINFYPSNPVGDANFTWEGNDLYVESNFDIGGIQLAFNTDFDYILSEELISIERLDYTQEDSKILMLYSFNNTIIASSKTKILTRLDASQEFDIEQAVVGTTSGAKLNAVLNNGVLSTIDAPFQNENLQFLNLFPNPAEGLVNLEYYLPNQMDQVVAKVYDLLGRLVHIQVLENREGISKTPMELSRLKTGNYIVLITANKNGSIKNIANKKLIIE
jgi:subtilisin family serine protease